MHLPWSPVYDFGVHELVPGWKISTGLLAVHCATSGDSPPMEFTIVAAGSPPTESAGVNWATMICSLFFRMKFASYMREVSVPFLLKLTSNELTSAESEVYFLFCVKLICQN